MSSVASEFIIRARAQFDEAGAKVKKFGLDMGGLTQIAGAVATGIGAAGVALVAFAAAAGEQQLQMERMATALSAAGLNAEQASARFESFFTAMSRATGYSDEQLRETVTLFAQQTSAMAPSMRDIQENAELIANIARQSGKSLTEVTMAVSKVFAGEASAIAELSPGLRGYSEELMLVTDRAERGELALAALSRQFQNAASTQLTLVRDMTVLRNELGDFGQSIGDVVLDSGLLGDALDSILYQIRYFDARLKDRDDPLTQNLTEVLDLAGQVAGALTQTFTVVMNLYEVASTSAEAAIAGTAALFLNTEAATNQAWEAGERAIAAYDQLGVSITDATGATEQMLDVSIATERQLSRMFNVPIERVQELQGSIQGLQASMLDFFGFADQQAQQEAPQRRTGGAAGGPDGPTPEQQAAKVKQTVTMMAEAERSANEILLENERLKQQALIEIQKEAAAQRWAVEEEFARNIQIKDQAMIETRKSQLDQQAETDRAFLQSISGQAQGAFTSVISASEAAFGALLGGTGNALDVFASGSLKGLGQVASSIGSLLILAGAGFSVLPGFLSAGAAIGAGFGLLGLGATLGFAGGQIGGGGGGGGGSSAPSGSAFSTGFMDSTRSQQNTQPPQITDYSGATFVAADARTFRFIADGTQRATRRGGVGVTL